MRVTDQARRALMLAAEAAHNLGDKPVSGYHLLLGLADAEGSARHVLGSSAGRLRDALPPSPADASTAEDIVNRAIRAAYAGGRDRATTADILCAALGPLDGPVATLVRAAGADPATIRAALAEGDHGTCCQETGVSEIRVLLAGMGAHANRIPGRGRAIAGMVGGLSPYLLLWSVVLAVTWDTSGPELVVVSAAVATLVSWLLGSIILRRRVRRSVARATITLPTPDSMRPLLDRLGLRQLEVRLQSGPAVDRCHRLGRRAWIVLGEGTERRPTVACFVLWHEVAHLARRDIAARGLAACLGYGLFIGALTSFDVRALAIAVTGTATLTVAGRWWSEAACDRFAVRQDSPEGLHAWAEGVRGGLAALRLQRKLSRWARVKGLFTHPPLALRAALHPTTRASRQDQSTEHDQPATV